MRVGGRSIVCTQLGALRGRRLVARTTEQTPYYSFKGISAWCMPSSTTCAWAEGPLCARSSGRCAGGGSSYAQPPRGSLRFRPPVPLEPWSGVRDALEEGAVCPHRFMLFDTYKGDEDCLYNPKLAVMVWIHGGAFAVGSGNAFLYGPDHLIGAEVVLDQVLALKWVRDSIEAFGGDPSRVTIFGESAGAVSVHLHMLSPASKGLFHGAIAESGVALAPWALAKSPRARAFELGKELGIDTNSTAELLGYLRATPSELLVKAGARIAAGAPGQSADLQSSVALPFLPALEPEGPGAFLTQAPRDTLPGADVPFLTGYNAQEGIILFRRKYSTTPSELLVKAGARIAAGAPGQSADLQSSVALPFLPALEPEGPGAFLTQAPRDTLPGADVPFLAGYNAQEGIILFRRKYSTTPSELLVKAGARIAAGAPGQSADLQSSVALPFLPALEPEGPGAFLTQAPRDSLPGADVPFLTGYNAQEGIILFRRKYSTTPSELLVKAGARIAAGAPGQSADLQSSVALPFLPVLEPEGPGAFLTQAPRDTLPGADLDTKFRRAVPPELLLLNETLAAKIGDAIRAFYFQQQPLFTDVMFLRPILETVRLQAETNRTSPTYLYRFAFDGALGLF
ncbi:Alpha-esterase [Operophtera brumata]|uniref:Carboxylic ester hydrolase n=1 Tax=Operophtera brumata TaxID=104452 RepID=A0A0L7LDD0_OPEBR|nr:Alpha-esterase [Operophtera brumata]